MNISAPFIRRPVATTLLTAAIAIAGAIAFTVLPVSPLPQVDFPTINVNTGLPGASAQIMASSVATPLERRFGHIAAVTEMTSSSLGAPRHLGADAPALVYPFSAVPVPDRGAPDQRRRRRAREPQYYCGGVGPVKSKLMGGGPWVCAWSDPS